MLFMEIIQPLFESFIVNPKNGIKESKKPSQKWDGFQFYAVLL